MADQHVLVVHPAPPDDRPHLRYTVECPGTTDDCRAWMECNRRGCPPFAPGSDAEEQAEADAEFTAHGVTHRWDGAGWLPLSWCWIAHHEALSDAAEYLLGADPAPGRYPIRHETDWRGEFLTLHLVQAEVVRDGA